MNAAAAKVLHFDAFKEQVLRHGDPDLEPLSVDYTHFELMRLGDVHTVKRKKKFRSVCQKGIILSDYSLVPFGWVGK